MVLMNSACQLASRTLPSEIAEPKTGKQRLWNAVLSFLSRRGHVWRDSEVDNSGVSFIKALIDTLWTINGPLLKKLPCSRGIQLCFGLQCSGKMKMKHTKYFIDSTSAMFGSSLCVSTGRGITGMNINPRLRHLPSPPKT